MAKSSLEWRVKVLTLIALTLSITSCQSLPGSQSTLNSAICDGTVEARKTHAAALIVDGGPQSKRTGASLLLKMKTGCNE